MPRKYTALLDETKEVPHVGSILEQVLSWLGYAALFAFCGWAFIELGIGADHLIEVISNWLVK